jgi:hypothetical protein
VLQAALQAAWAEILVETASSFHGLDSPSKAALKTLHCKQEADVACKRLMFFEPIHSSANYKMIESLL